MGAKVEGKNREEKIRDEKRRIEQNLCLVVLLKCIL